MKTKEPKYSHKQIVNTIFLLIYRYKGDAEFMQKETGINASSLNKWRVKYGAEVEEIMKESSKMPESIDEIMIIGLKRIYTVITTCAHPEKIALAMMRLKEIEPSLPLGTGKGTQTSGSLFAEVIKELEGMKHE
jgi:hypothetical protein